MDLIKTKPKPHQENLHFVWPPPIFPDTMSSVSANLQSNSRGKVAVKRPYSFRSFWRSEQVFEKLAQKWIEYWKKVTL